MNDIEKFFQNLGKNAQKITMSSAEKEQHRDQLLHFMQKTVNVPVYFPKPIKSAHPLAKFYKRINFVYLIIAGILVTGVGVAYAAQNALPGDLLYGVKTNVLEKIQTSLAFSPQQKADLNENFAIRRLQEAEALIQAHHLDDAKIQELSANFSTNQQALMTDISELKDEHEDDAASKISSNFSEAIQSHNQVFNSIINRKGFNDENGPNVPSLNENKSTQPVKANWDTKFTQEILKTTAPAILNVNTKSLKDVPRFYFGFDTPMKPENTDNRDQNFQTDFVKFNKD